jgi:hypothetical protein
MSFLSQWFGPKYEDVAWSSKLPLPRIPDKPTRALPVKRCDELWQRSQRPGKNLSRALWWAINMLASNKGTG